MDKKKNVTTIKKTKKRKKSNNTPNVKDIKELDNSQNIKNIKKLELTCGDTLIKNSNGIYNFFHESYFYDLLNKYDYFPQSISNLLRTILIKIANIYRNDKPRTNNDCENIQNEDRKIVKRISNIKLNNRDKNAYKYWFLWFKKWELIWFAVLYIITSISLFILEIIDKLFSTYVVNEWFLIVLIIFAFLLSICIPIFSIKFFDKYKDFNNIVQYYIKDKVFSLIDKNISYDSRVKRFIFVPLNNTNEKSDFVLDLNIHDLIYDDLLDIYKYFFMFSDGKVEFSFSNKKATFKNSILNINFILKFNEFYIDFFNSIYKSQINEYGGEFIEKND